MPIIVARDGINEAGQKIAQDSSGNVYAVYSDGASIYLKTSVDSWAAETVLIGEAVGSIITGGDGKQCNNPCIIIVDNKLHLLLKMDSTPPGVGLYHTVCVNLSLYNQTSSWKMPDQTTNGFGAIQLGNRTTTEMSMASDSTGKIYTTFKSADSPVIVNEVYIFKWDGSDWGGLLLYSTTPVIGGTSVVVDENDFIHVAFGVSSNVQYAKSTAASTLTFPEDVTIITIVA